MAEFTPFGRSVPLEIRNERTLPDTPGFGYIAFLFNEINYLNHTSSVAQRLL